MSGVPFESLGATLVTGASGWLGAAVARDLVAAGHGVRTLQRRASGVDGADDVLGSVTDVDAIDHALAGVDSVVHLAAKVSFAGPEADFVAVNIDGTRRLVRAAKRAGVWRFVFISSPSVAHTGEPIPSIRPSVTDTRVTTTSSAPSSVASGSTSARVARETSTTRCPRRAWATASRHTSGCSHEAVVARNVARPSSATSSASRPRRDRTTRSTVPPCAGSHP